MGGVAPRNAARVTRGRCARATPSGRAPGIGRRGLGDNGNRHELVGLLPQERCGLVIRWYSVDLARAAIHAMHDTPSHCAPS